MHLLSLSSFGSLLCPEILRDATFQKPFSAVDSLKDFKTLFISLPSFLSPSLLERLVPLSSLPLVPQLVSKMP